MERDEVGAEYEFGYEETGADYGNYEAGAEPYPYETGADGRYEMGAPSPARLPPRGYPAPPPRGYPRGYGPPPPYGRPPARMPQQQAQEGPVRSKGYVNKRHFPIGFIRPSDREGVRFGHLEGTTEFLGWERPC